MRQAKWLVRWFTAEDWRTWVSHFVLLFLAVRALGCGASPLVVYFMVVATIFGATYKEYLEYNEHRDSLDSVMDALAYVAGAMVAAATLGLF